MTNIAIVGIGVLLSDEGVGVHAVEAVLTPSES